MGISLSKVDEYVKHRLNLSSYDLSSYEQQFLSHIETIIPSDPDASDYFLNELFKGAYIFIPDNGFTYELLTSHEPDKLINRNSSSSHHSLEPQYGFSGHLVGQCLFGTNVVGEEKGTWFQLEAYGTDFLHIAGHLYTYVKYLYTGYNQGPHGSSPHTEANPILVKLEDSLKINTDVDATTNADTKTNMDTNISVDTNTTANTANYLPDVVVEPPSVNVIKMSDVFVDMHFQQEKVTFEYSQIESISFLNGATDSSNKSSTESEMVATVLEPIHLIVQQPVIQPMEVIITESI